MNEDDFQKYWIEAAEYNAELSKRKNIFELSSKMREQYANCLNVDGTGMMGYIDVPKIGVTLPVYHGTSDGVLRSAIGHIEWTSLPTGGAGTHCAVSGHRGLPGAKLFTDLDKLREGDVFTLTVMKETLTYEVDQIRTVVPKDLLQLGISEGKDYCTLVTCTPYGINSHRLLVRGHRIGNAVDVRNLFSEAVRVEQLIVAGCLAVPLLLLLFFMVMFKKPENKAKPQINFSAEKQNKET